MSCWRRTTVLRIPAICLGFQLWGEWEAFLEEHDLEFDWEPGCFSSSLCESYSYEDYSEWLPGGRDSGPWDRLDMGLYPDTVQSVPGPFLDYWLEDVIPLPPEQNAYHARDIARPLSAEERRKYLPLYRTLFPDFSLKQMKDVHYCRYEWYDGSEAAYLY